MDGPCGRRVRACIQAPTNQATSTPTSTSTAGTVCQCSAAAALYVGRFFEAEGFFVGVLPFLPLLLFC